MNGCKHKSHDEERVLYKVVSGDVAMVNFDARNKRTRK
jgi:hypothetical protein